MASTIRAKFECTGAEEIGYGTGTAVAVTMVAVYGDGTDNAAWSQATPSGTLSMTITNPAALGAFVVGTAYYLDLTPVQAPAAAASPVAQASTIVIPPTPDAPAAAASAN